MAGEVLPGPGETVPGTRLTVRLVAPEFKPGEIHSFWVTASNNLGIESDSSNTAEVTIPSYGQPDGTRAEGPRIQYSCFKILQGDGSYSSYVYMYYAVKQDSTLQIWKLLYGTDPRNINTLIADAPISAGTDEYGNNIYAFFKEIPGNMTGYYRLTSELTIGP